MKVTKVLAMAIVALSTPVVSGCATNTDESPTSTVDATTGTPEGPDEKDLEAVSAMDSWLTRAEYYDIPDVYFDGDGSDQAAKLYALADNYPVSDSTVSDDLRAAAKSLRSGYQHLDERDYEAAASAFDEIPARLDSLPNVVESDIAVVEAETGWLVTNALGFSDGFSTMYEWPHNAQIGEWIDGDTLVTRRGTEVRLVGIDTPELSESCSKAEEALAAAEQLAPPGTDITLHTPWLLDPTDKYGRELHYVDLDDGTDVGYSLLLSDLAQPRYDSRDGYRWHVREKAYRDTGAEPGADVACTFAEPPFIKLAKDEDRDDPRRERYEAMDTFESTLEGSGKALGNLVNDARKSHERADRRSNQRSEGDDSDSSDGSGSDKSFDFPDSLCPTRWC